MSLEKTLLCRSRFGYLRHIVRVAAAAFGLLAAAAATAGNGRDILLEMVTACVDASAAGYCAQCRWPRGDAQCAPALDCRQSTEVWGLDSRYAAIRDRKMCGCPADFVHGLAVPRTPVRGVEDPSRPDGIWQFAWDVARRRIEPSVIALAVNPARRRSQDQLHVHLVKLRPGLDQALSEHVVGYVTDLGEVWRVAARGAAARGLDDYGVLVARRSDSEFQVIVTADSPEKAFTEWECTAPVQEPAR